MKLNQNQRGIEPELSEILVNCLISTTPDYTNVESIGFIFLFDKYNGPKIGYYFKTDLHRNSQIYISLIKTKSVQILTPAPLLKIET